MILVRNNGFEEDLSNMGHWASEMICDRCNKLIEGGVEIDLEPPSGLLDRSVETYRKLYPDDKANTFPIRIIINKGHAAFWQNRTGKYETL
jgi:hypothetical protein